jgi:hypothetical protein
VVDLMTWQQVPERVYHLYRGVLVDEDAHQAARS